MGYDQWLEQPYQDAYQEQERFDLAEQIFCDSHIFDESYQDWLDDGNDGDYDAWIETQDYISCVQSFAEGMYGGGRDE